jgi:hypothetical protein
MSDDQESIPLRLRWAATWPDKDADFSAEAPGYNGPVGRIYLHSTGGFQNGRWFWAFQAAGGEISRNIGDTSGYEDSARAAARRVESAWFLAIRGTRHDLPEEAAPPARPPVNAYAAAKAR